MQVLLDAGITVLTSLNIQHLESLNDQIWQMTGVRVRETLPDWVVDQADEIVVVDVTPRALRHRLERGVIYSREKAEKALENFFAEHNLSALREIAMRHAAHEIEEKLSVGDGSAPSAGLKDSSASAEPSGRKECILICIDERPSAAVLIRRGRRVADYLRAECLAIYVSPDPALSHLSQEQREAVEKHLGFARNLRIEVSVIEGDVVADGVVEFARTRHATQIFMGRSPSAQLETPLARQHSPPGRPPGARHGDHHRGRAPAVKGSTSNYLNQTHSLPQVQIPMPEPVGPRPACAIRLHCLCSLPSSAADSTPGKKFDSLMLNKPFVVARTCVIQAPSKPKG